MHARRADTSILTQAFAEVAGQFRSNKSYPAISLPCIPTGLSVPWIDAQTAIHVVGPLVMTLMEHRTNGDTLKLHARCVDAAVTAALAAVEAGLDPEKAASLLLQSAVIGTRIPLESATDFSKSTGLI